jgi:hypothetical protein
LSGLALVAAGCIFPKAAPVPGPVTAADVDRGRYRWRDIDHRSLSEGRELFATHCNRCHDYPALTAIPEGDWPSIIEKMARKAKLSRDQSQRVLRFVLVARVR